MEQITKPTKCPICGNPLKRIEGGISKRTGKPYSAFWACSNRDCDYTWNEPKKSSYYPVNSEQYKKEEPKEQPQEKSNSLDPNLVKALSLIRSDIAKVMGAVETLRDFLKFR